MPQIPILDLRPQLNSIKGEVMQAVESVIDSTAYINGPATRQFETDVAEYLGVKHAIGLNSGTDALIVGLRALGIKSGDEVITTPFSFFATAESISIIGAVPVFVDIEEDSFNINCEEIEAAITNKTKAIMPVHLFGRPANIAQIVNIAEQKGLKVIEDCAQSFGAKIDGKHTGAWGDGGAFSFFPSKNLGAMGDGGLFVTNCDDAAHQALKLRNHGGIDKYSNDVLGYNSRLDSIQAAILGVKLKHIDEWNSGRRKVAQRYNDLFSDFENIICPDVVEGHVFHQYTIRIIGRDRDQVHQKMNESGIGCMVYYPTPQDLLPVYGQSSSPHKVSTSHAAEVLSLPIWPEMSAEVQETIANALGKALM
ncbi:MAG: DegT/DnrJ/EryC1/StrS family aminotransferase [Planctomycetota bacterium]|nr:DegT/DnrJ/EryC1/StrS family aminotransferase [Planctomycetota bacterium]